MPRVDPVIWIVEIRLPFLRDSAPEVSISGRPPIYWLATSFDVNDRGSPWSYYIAACATYAHLEPTPKVPSVVGTLQ
jgi:hypothetical protein